MSEEKKPAASEPVKAPAVVLADAAASSDGYVHQLLALRHTAELNGDKEAANAVTAQLGELGYR